MTVLVVGGVVAEAVVVALVKVTAIPHVGQGLKGELYPAIIYANDKYSATIHTNAKERLEVPRPSLTLSTSPIPTCGVSASLPIDPALTRWIGQVPSFDPSCLPPEIELMDYDMVARNTTTSGSIPPIDVHMDHADVAGRSD